MFPSYPLLINGGQVLLSALEKMRYISSWTKQVNITNQIHFIKCDVKECLTIKYNEHQKDTLSPTSHFFVLGWHDIPAHVKSWLRKCLIT